MNAQRVVVMGLGNLLWADEGFGIRVAERLYARYHWPEEVEIVDGGTQGLNLLGYVEQASHLLLLDAIDYGLAPGSLRTYAGEKIPAYLSAKKMSLHQNSFPKFWRWPTSAGICPVTLRWSVCNRRTWTTTAVA
ncbi:hydrogenase 1 maturation protease [Salmonella enterica subsp. enterica serovar Enteritidis str. SE30663]|nr:hydrogenase 1 maturation protease [Salmonella enterica subsp. enterica serovar Enteritidis str. SE30663]